MSGHSHSFAVNWPELLAAQFCARSHPIYVLGCFARHVTLYSQQVRALNLIYGLYKTGKLRKNPHIGVIGGGAAGLTAAAAAAFRGAKVTLLDELAGPMELQQNNRQRWIHPFIYDWPYPDNSLFERFKQGEACLPLLTWSADYAANVARRISSQWDLLQDAYDIDPRWCVRKLKIYRRRNGSIDVRWNGNQLETFSLLILAVGFGLEPKRQGQDSYWAEDDLDGGFRKLSRRNKWLLSGGGDGALTDLMRLSMRRFRQDEILSLFVTTPGIDGLKQELRKLRSYAAEADQQKISDEFEAIAVDSELKSIVEDQVRRDGPKILLVTKDPSLYGPGTSILNRLIVRMLHELPPKVFEHRVGRVTQVVSKTNDFRVRIRSGRKSTRYKFDRVLLRHGPKRSFPRDFPSIYRSCRSLEAAWKHLSIDDDITRRPAWSNGFFGPEPTFRTFSAENVTTNVGDRNMLDDDSSFEHSVQRFGFYAEAFTVIRHVRSDGSSQVTYAVDGLSVIRGTLKGISFRYTSETGIVGPVRLDASPGSGLKWIAEEANRRVGGPLERGTSAVETPSDPDPVAPVREKVRRLSGTVHFRTPIGPPDHPLSFRLNFRILNGDALSSWEFEQMYNKEQQKHADGKPLRGPTEYLARYVWFPTRMFRVIVNLPTRITRCVPSVFLFDKHDEISRRHVVKSGVVMRSRPRRWSEPPKAIAKPLLPPKDMGMFRKIAPHSWSLSVPNPAVGSCYSLDWPLPRSPENSYTQVLEKQARSFREALLRYRNRFLGNPGDQVPIARDRHELAHQALVTFYRAVVPGRKRSNGLELVVMAYSEKLRRLFVVDGIRDGRSIGPETRNFSLPFGLGLAGSCFKDGSRVFLIDPAKSSEDSGFSSWRGHAAHRPEADPGYYLRIPGTRRHKFLFQVPVDHPSYKPLLCPEGYERSRQCIGVVGLASIKGEPSLSGIVSPDVFGDIKDFCQGLCDRLYRILVPF
jgi:hypothetical protein